MRYLSEQVRPPEKTEVMEFVPIYKWERDRFSAMMRDGNHIGRLWESGKGDLWHVFRHRDGVLVCWRCLTHVQVYEGVEPVRVVTNTRDVNELEKYLPTAMTFGTTKPRSYGI